MIRVNRGLSRDHRKPTIEFLYFTSRFLEIRFLNSSLYEIRFSNFVILSLRALCINYLYKHYLRAPSSHELPIIKKHYENSSKNRINQGEKECPGNVGKRSILFGY